MNQNNENNQQNIERKRLYIYLAFSFGLAWALFFIFIINGYRWNSEDRMSSVLGLGMLAPLLANLITRLITKEGFAMTGKDSLMLGISFKNKKWIYLCLACVLPWIYFEIFALLEIIAVPEAFDLEYYKHAEIDKVLVYLYPVIIIINTSIVSFAALGEEGGWRGYMMPKLMKLMSLPKAIIVGGIIWGLWHAPLTCIGHNFGTDYIGFPYLGIVIMCIFCTVIGIILTFITIKTESIWPATIMHAVNNGNPSILRFFINSEIFEAKISNILIQWTMLLVPLCIISIVCLIIMNKKKE